MYTDGRRGGSRKALNTSKGYAYKVIRKLNEGKGMLVVKGNESTPIPLTPFTPPSGCLRLRANWPPRTRRC